MVDPELNSPFFKAGLDQTTGLAANIIIFRAQDSTQSYRDMFGWKRKLNQIEMLGPQHGTNVLRNLTQHVVHTGDLSLEYVTGELVRYCKDNSLSLPQPKIA